MTQCIPHPVYDLETPSSIHLTTDGRIGRILRFSNDTELLKAFRETVKRYPFLHTQAQDFFGIPLLSISKYTYRPQPSFIGCFRIKKINDLKAAWLETDQILSDVWKMLGKPSLLTTYPELPNTQQYRMFKLKYLIDWVEDERMFQRRQGFCVIKTPSDSKIRVMYNSTATLENFLLDRILCIEFTGEFKTRAEQFWKPLGTMQFLADLFRL
jgi:hypothetical protein